MDINLQAPVDFSFATRAHSQRPKTEHFGGVCECVGVKGDRAHTKKKAKEDAQFFLQFIMVKRIMDACTHVCKAGWDVLQFP